MKTFIILILTIVSDVIYGQDTVHDELKRLFLDCDINLTPRLINLLQRTADREFLPMAREFGMGTMMYSPLAGGILTRKYRKGETGRITIDPGSDYGSDYQESVKTKDILDKLLSIAEELEATPGQVAFAWVLSRRGFSNFRGSNH